MRIFVRTYEEEGEKCLGCGWEVMRLFTFAETEEEANRLFKAYEEQGEEVLNLIGTAPLCAECMMDVLVEGKHIICRDPHLVLEEAQGIQGEEVYRIYLSPHENSKDLIPLGEMQNFGQAVEGKIILKEVER